MSLLKEFAIKALKEGSDYFGETITGEVGKLQYVEAQNYYALTVFLIEEWPIGSKPRPSTSGVGFYVSKNGLCLEVMSGHFMPWVVPLTSGIVSELGNAEIVPF